MISIVGENWRTDCAAEGGGCSGLLGDEPRPLGNIVVELVGATDSIVIAEDISARGEDESWFLTFRVPNLPEGTYRIYAHAEDGDSDVTNSLSLRISRDAPSGFEAST